MSILSMIRTSYLNYNAQVYVINVLRFIAVFSELSLTLDFQRNISNFFHLNSQIEFSVERLVQFPQLLGDLVVADFLF